MKYGMTPTVLPLPTAGHNVSHEVVTWQSVHTGKLTSLVQGQLQLFHQNAPLDGDNVVGRVRNDLSVETEVENKAMLVDGRPGAVATRGADKGDGRVDGFFDRGDSVCLIGRPDDGPWHLQVDIGPSLQGVFELCVLRICQDVRVAGELGPQCVDEFLDLHHVCCQVAEKDGDSSQLGRQECLKRDLSATWRQATMAYQQQCSDHSVDYCTSNKQLPAGWFLPSLHRPATCPQSRLPLVRCHVIDGRSDPATTKQRHCSRLPGLCHRALLPPIQPVLFSLLPFTRTDLFAIQRL